MSTEESKKDNDAQDILGLLVEFKYETTNEVHKNDVYSGSSVDGYGKRTKQDIDGNMKERKEDNDRERKSIM